MSDFYLTTDIEKYRDTLESICKESSDYLMKVEGRPALSAFADVYMIPKVSAVALSLPTPRRMS